MSKNLKGKNAFTSLRINRAAEEEIKKCLSYNIKIIKSKK